MSKIDKFFITSFIILAIMLVVLPIYVVLFCKAEKKYIYNIYQNGKKISEDCNYGHESYTTWGGTYYEKTGIECR